MTGHQDVGEEIASPVGARKEGESAKAGRSEPGQAGFTTRNGRLRLTPIVQAASTGGLNRQDEAPCRLSAPGLGSCLSLKTLSVRLSPNDFRSGSGLAEEVEPIASEGAHSGYRSRN
jgi:hypothetical protein